MSGRPLLTITFIGALPQRKLSADTLRRWGVGVASAMGGSVLAFPYRDDQGTVVAQKCKTIEKDFFITGSLKDAQLFGQHLWGKSQTRRVIVTEGELDAMTVDQCLGGKWPVVSIPNGAQGARKALAAQLQWLNTFEEVVLCFDMDDPGKEAVADCVGLFPVGKVSIVTLPLKDPSDMLQANQAQELVIALWSAKPYLRHPRRCDDAPDHGLLVGMAAAYRRHLRSALGRPRDCRRWHRCGQDDVHHATSRP
jgi:twinkle protein